MILAFGGGLLRGDKIVRMIYLDESGISAGEPYLVVAGAIVHADKQWKAIEKYLHDMAQDVMPPQMRSGFFFHATELYHGSKKFDRATWSKEARWKLLDELVSIPAKFDLPLVVGFVRKSEFQKNHSHKLKVACSAAVNAQAVALLICAVTAEKWFDKAAENDEVGVLIAEDNKEARGLMKTVINFNRNPELVSTLPEETRKHVPLTRIVDTIHFAEKGDSSPLQIADVVAFVTMRR